jgi:plastocyanin
MTFARLIGVAVLAGSLSCSSNSGSNVTGPSSTPLPAGSADVTIQDFTFSPASVSIKVGATVRWTNRGPSAHTTTSDNGVWDSGQLNPPSSGGSYGGGGTAGTFQTTFSKAGTYGYHCSIHPPSMYPGFTGTVVVTP